MCHRVASLEKQFGHIPEAELVPQSPQHREQHDVCRVLEIVEGRAGPFVEAPAARATAKPLVVQRRAMLAPGRGG